VSDWDGIPEHWGAGHYRDIPWSKYVLAGRRRHIEDLKRQNDPSFPYYYDDAVADRAVAVAEMLRQFEGEWFNQPLELSDWEEWDIIRPIFGWLRKDNNLRRYRTAYVEVARGNGKSTIAALVAVILTAADREPSAQVYSAATKEEQARIVWDYARKMVELSPELREEFRVHRNALVNDTLWSSYKPIGRDSKTQDGFSVHGGVVDEYHAHKDSGMFDVLSSGRRSRRQPLLFIITTAGFGLETPCKKESDFAKRLLEGSLQNDQYFAFIATVDDPEKWQDPDEWIKANPNWGISVNVDQFMAEFQEALQLPSKQNGFKTKRLNIWCEQASRWLTREAWLKCGGPVDRYALAGRRCFAGLDLGISRDITSLILAFMDEKDQGDKEANILPKVNLLGFHWVPEGMLWVKKQTDNVDYPTWADQGWIQTTPGDTTRYDYVRKKLNELAREFEIAEIAVDKAHAHQLMTQLADDDLTVVDHSQSMAAMTYPCKTFEELVIQGRLGHGDDPVLAWMADNVAVIKGADDKMKVAKDKSANRVDGITAAVMAVGRLMLSPEPVNNVYESRGIAFA